MSDFNRAYAFVSEWLWDYRKYGSVRRTTDRAWDKQQCADVADMINDYTKELQTKIEKLEAEAKSSISVMDHVDEMTSVDEDNTLLQAKIEELENRIKWLEVNWCNPNGEGD